MRIKQLQEKLIRSRTSLPPRISSYKKSRIVENGSCSGTTRNTTRVNNYCSRNTFKFIHLLSTVVIFCFPPLIIIYAILYDQGVASVILGFNLLLLLICIYDLFLVYIELWPNNKLYMMAVSIFALSLIQCIPFLYVQLMLCPIIALLIVSNKVEENQHIQVLSRVYLGAISLNVILLTVGDVSFYYGKLGTALSCNLASYILSICLLIIHTSYGLYCHMNMETIIDTWEFNGDKQKRKKKSNNNINV
ncbi:hypothetical protein FRACYDRAFT_244920 [Fragilariopsis cylindrus CCMP1102]|uniref:Uncharacterized protein n=1 Tax=Fragilariopsis cylindrus CCMP1102 TaxID=635003 RepID=A0A1E7F104_9STRA|nr:hypothetical protein FRACYDRAFT_244920 [Fragilariopsis cylindrus CCMP1102]|eukprot:OEU11796.1 hypothetical protein FRACYDRAFT_244920 [Fragilariopsis cylindrus CCMP1102]